MKRRPGEESDADSSRDTSSDDSGEFGTDGGVSIVQGTSRPPNCSGAVAEGLSSPSLTCNPFRGLSGDENKANNHPGILVFEYLDSNQPYAREPLADKASS